MQTQVHVSVSQLRALAGVIAEIDDSAINEATRIRLCTDAHNQIADMLGPHAHIAYDTEEAA